MKDFFFCDINLQDTGSFKITSGDIAFFICFFPLRLLRLLHCWAMSFFLSEWGSKSFFVTSGILLFVCHCPAWMRKKTTSIMSHFPTFHLRICLTHMNRSDKLIETAYMSTCNFSVSVRWPSCLFYTRQRTRNVSSKLLRKMWYEIVLTI